MSELRLWTWPWLIATTMAKSILAVVVCLGLWGAVPAAVGWLPTTVSSGSMLPRLHVGDVAVSRPLGTTPPTMGSVLLFDDPDHPGRLRLHRFVRIDDDGRLVTRGDANAGDDSSPVELGAVRGVGTLRVPWVALPVVWLRERSWVPLGASLAVLVALTAVAAHGRNFGFPEPDEPTPDEDSDPEGHGGGEPDSQPATGTAAGPGASEAPASSGAARTGALAVAIGLSLVGAAPAAAAFTDATTSNGALAAATYFRCANAVAASTPYLWYRMDETTSTTTAADSSSGNRDGVYSSSGRTIRASRACARDSGQAMTFNGSTGYLSSPLIRGTAPNTFSIAIWLRTTTGRGGKLLGLGNSQTGASTTMDRHLYMTNAGRIVFGVYPSTVKTITSPTAYNDGDWHHCVATLSTAGMRLYLDGELVASDASVTTGEPISSSYVRIAYDSIDGWPSTPTSRYFAGTLDDAVFSLSALTASQVQDHYEAGT